MDMKKRHGCNLGQTMIRTLVIFAILISESFTDA